MKTAKVYYEVLVVSERGNELCSEGSFGSEHAAMSAVPRLLEMSPNARSWEIVKVSREITMSGSGRPSPKDLVSSRRR